MLLARQLRKLGLDGDSPPDAQQWRAFLESVRRTYVQADQDRYTIERSLMVLSGEMQRLYSELRRSESNFRLLVEHTPDAIFVHRANVVVYANPAMAQLLGYATADELVGQRSLERFVHPDDWDAVGEHRRLVAEGHAVHDLRVRWVRRDGGQVTVHGVGAPIDFDDQPAVVTIARDVSERIHAERERELTAQSLRSSEERYRLLFEASPLSIMLFDPESLRILAVNEAAASLYGYSREELLALRLMDLKVGEDEELRESMETALEPVSEGSKRTVWRGTKKHRRKDSTVIDVSITSIPVVVNGRVAVQATAMDVTETRRLEQQLQHAQKMEAVGRLAGGIAHDFNNLMSVVLSYSHMLIDGGGLNDESQTDLVQVRLAGERAAKLTKQLLAFSRKQVLSPEVVDLNRVIGGMDRMLRPLLGDNVEVDKCLDARGSVYADPSQLELILMNLVVNARDAMPYPGRLGIETRDVTIRDGSEIGAPGATPGRYVRLSVSDTGIGMDAEIRTRIFEPFFTTKEQGRGTGLGLATVFGIVKQSEGHITVDSAPGEGTTFHIYLPHADDTPEAVRSSAPSPVTLRGKETVLLVEDDELVRRSVRTMLSRNGYRVLEAQNAGEAFLIFEDEHQSIDVIVTDVMMPRMSGPQLVRRLVALRPNIKVLYVSGYAEDLVARECTGGPSVRFLAKPLTPALLARKVREVLDAGPESAPSSPHVVSIVLAAGPT